jgi:hypothetical protein
MEERGNSCFCKESNHDFSVFKWQHSHCTE